MTKNKKKNLKINVSTLYLPIAFLFILGFGFFGTSKLFLAEDIPINQTKLNEEFDLRANGNFTIKEWIYDKKENLMEVTLVTSGIEDYKTFLEFTAVSREKLNKELPTEIVYNETDIYIIHIKDVPADFNQLALRFNKGEKSYDNLFSDESTMNEDKVISTIYTDQRVVKEKPVQRKNFNEYAIKITGELIEDAEQKINELERQQQMTDDVISEISEQIEQLQVDLLYQTLDEQVDTTNEVYELQKEITSYEKSKETLAEDIKNIRSKIERLKQKQYDLNI